MAATLTAGLLQSALTSPTGFTGAFDALNPGQQAHLLHLAAQVIEYRAEMLGNHINDDRSAPVNEYSRWKSLEAAARLIETASDLIGAELVRQGCTWEYGSSTKEGT